MTEIIVNQRKVNPIVKTIPLVANNFKQIKKNLKIIQADCLLALDKMESNSVDCIITDPPYFLDGMENN